MEGIHPSYRASATAAEAAVRDTDGDGKSDLQEAHDFTDPTVPDRELTFEERVAQQQQIQQQARAELPEEFRTLEGGVAVLSGTIHNGQPVYVSTRNANAASTISLSPLLPGGTTGYDLSGLLADPGLPPVKLGVWEPKHPLVTHTEFSGRLIDKDGPVDPSEADNHATQVMGTGAARGAVSSAKGMAPAAIVHARDQDGDLDEMAGIFASTSDPEDHFFVSNHSYGIDPGWTTFRFTGSPLWVPQLDADGNEIGTKQLLGDTAYPYWSGRSDLSITEDYRFGFYSADESEPLDYLTYESDTLLPVWAAGNDRGQ